MPKVVNIEGVGKVNFPDDFTPERIQFAIENDILPRLNKPPAPAAKPYAVESPDALVRLGRGFMDVAQGVKQGGLMLKDLFTGDDEAGAYTKEKDAEIALYNRGRGPDAGIDWMRLGGNVLGTLPVAAIPGAGAATLPIRMLAGAGQGAAASAALYTPEGQSKTGQIALGGLVGGAVPAVFEGGRRAVGSIMNKVRPPQVNTGGLADDISVKLQQKGIDFNNLTNDVKASLLADAQKTLQAGGTLDDAMLANKALIESIGAKSTRAAVTRAPRDWQAEKNLRGIAGVGDDIVEREQTNAKAMVDYLAKLRGETGGKASTALEAGESAINAIQAQDAAKEAAVTKLYTAYREIGAENTVLPVAKVKDALTNVADDIGLDALKKDAPSVLTRMKEFGLFGDKAVRYLTIKEADRFNRLLNENNPGHGPASKAIAMIKNAVNESMLDAPARMDGTKMGAKSVEALLTARKAAAERFAEQRAGKGIAAAIKDVSPDRFVKKFVMDADVRDVRAMMLELGKSIEGKQAVNDMKGHVLDNLLMKSTGASNIDDVVGKPFIGSRFGKALDAIPPEKLHILFKPEEITALRDLQKASKLLTEEVPFSDVNHSKTAAALANLFLKVGNTPILGRIVSPIIGIGKIGMEWVKNADARKQVAEALLGSAAKVGEKAKLPPPGDFTRLLPASAGAAATEMTYGADE